MIISLQEAHDIDPNITTWDLKAYETQVRGLTNNNFQHPHIRMTNIGLVGDKIIAPKEFIGFKLGDTIEIYNSKFNDGLYAVESVSAYELTVDADFVSEVTIQGGVAKIDYPADIKAGLLNVIRYNQKMGDKVGVKSESVARMSTTYFDVSNTDNVEGIPSSQWAFLNKYKKIRW